MKCLNLIERHWGNFPVTTGHAPEHLKERGVGGGYASLPGMMQQNLLTSQELGTELEHK